MENEDTWPFSWFICHSCFIDLGLKVGQSRVFSLLTLEADLLMKKIVFCENTNEYCNKNCTKVASWFLIEERKVA